MKTTFITCCAIFLSLVTGQPVRAQSVPDGDWGGFYIGAQIGTSELSDDTDIDRTISGGVHLGYLYDFGQIVLGGELSYDDQSGFDGPFACNNVSATALHLRGGYDAGRFLPYAKVGVANVDIGGCSTGSDIVTSLGLGIDYQLSERFRLGLEYTHRNEDNFDGGGFRYNDETIQLRGGLNF